MASVPITPIRQTIFEDDMRYKRSWSEALGFKIGSAINFINNRMLYVERVDYGGFFRPTSIDQYEHSIYILRDTKISAYSMSIAVTANGNHQLNYAVIDNLGVNIGNLFTTPMNINGNGFSDTAVGKDIKNSLDLDRNTPGTFDNGTLDPSYLDTSIPAGYSLRPFIVSSSKNAIGLSATLFMEIQS